jgi:hypothetical protein
VAVEKLDELREAENPFDLLKLGLNASLDPLLLETERLQEPPGQPPSLDSTFVER